VTHLLQKKLSLLSPFSSVHPLYRRREKQADDDDKAAFRKKGTSMNGDRRGRGQRRTVLIVPKLTPNLRRLVDEYADTLNKVAAWKPAVNPDIARLAELSSQIRAATDRQPAGEELLLRGLKYDLPVGAKRIKRTIINIPRLFRKMGMAWVEEHCAPALGDLDKALTEDERAGYVKEERILSRIIGQPVTTETLPLRKAA